MSFPLSFFSFSGEDSLGKEKRREEKEEGRVIESLNMIILLRAG